MSLARRKKRDNKVYLKKPVLQITNFLLDRTVKIVLISMELPKRNFKENLAYVGSEREAQEQRLAGCQSCFIPHGSLLWEGGCEEENPTAHVLKVYPRTLDPSP